MGAVLTYVEMPVNTYWCRSQNYEQGQMRLERYLPRLGNKEKVHLNQKRNQDEHIRSS
jgi:hypothetical protein